MELPTDDIIKFVKKRQKEWNNHVSRADERLIKIAQDKKAKGRRPGRPVVGKLNLHVNRVT